jgi:hypothetical protein
MLALFSSWPPSPRTLNARRDGFVVRVFVVAEADAKVDRIVQAVGGQIAKTGAITRERALRSLCNAGKG